MTGAFSISNRLYRKPLPHTAHASPRRARAAPALLVAGALALLPACRTPSAAAPLHPSVLLITVDALRPDRLSCYGYGARRTAHIDAIAHDGALFEHAVCDVPWTTGSMASVLTSHYASRHRLRLSTERLPDDLATLPEVLRRQGYATGAIIGSFPLASIYHLNRGFDTYDEDFTTPMVPAEPGQPVVTGDGRPWPVEKVAPLLNGSPEEMQRYFARKVTNDAFRPDDQVTDRAVAWLRAHREQPFFLWVHYFGPHERVNLLQTWAAQSPRVIAEYDRDLAFTDAQIGRLLAAIDDLGLRDRLLLVLHADHGQSLGEDDYVGHGENLYQPNLRIPLLLRFPGRIAPGTRLPATAQNIDIFPTVLGLLGLPPLPDVSGADLSPLLTGAAAPGDAAQLALRPMYSETFLSTFAVHAVPTTAYGTVRARLEQFGLRRGDRMYVLSAFVPPCARADGGALPDDDCRRLRHEELYDAAADPAGTHDLSAAHAAELAWFREHIAAFGANPVRPDGNRIELSPGDKEKLRALGYNS